MSATTLRLKLGYRLAMLGVFIALLPGLGILGSFVFPLIQAGSASPEDSFALVSNVLRSGLVVMLAVFVLLVVVLGYVVLSVWIYRLELGETHLRLRTIYHPVQRPFRCAYSQIQRIQRAHMRGILAIVLEDGRWQTLGANSFEGGAERLLAELSRRLPAERIEADLAAALQRHTRQDRRFRLLALTNLVTQSALLLGLLTTLLQSVGVDFLRSHTAWKAATSLPPLSHVEAFSLDNDGSPWMAIRTGFGEQYTLIHVGAGKSQSWRLPPEAGELSLTGPYGVGRDPGGQPWAAFMHGILYWEGESWKQIPLPQSDRPEIPLTASGSGIWVLPRVTAGSSLYRLDLSAGTSAALPLPAAAAQADLTIHHAHLLPDNDLWVLFSHQETYRVYRLRPEGWEETGIPLPQLANNLFISDLTLGPEGKIWVLRMRESAQIGAFDPGTQTWSWYELPSPASSGSEQRYDGIQVDALGRVWIEGTESGETYEKFVDVFRPTATGKLEKVVRYTTRDSNYQQGLSSSRLRLGPDGRMWSADDTLAWIDSNAALLPAPLPAWVTSFSSSRSKNIAVAITLCVAVLNFIVVMWYALQWRRLSRDWRSPTSAAG